LYKKTGKEKGGAKKQQEMLAELAKSAPELGLSISAYEKSLREKFDGKGKSAKEIASGKEARALDAAKDKTGTALYGNVAGDTNSSLASDASVKAYFSSLGENNSKIAQLLGNVATGKPPGEGLDKPKVGEGTVRK
jgi:hypothetical protein